MSCLCRVIFRCVSSYYSIQIKSFDTTKIVEQHKTEIIKQIEKITINHCVQYAPYYPPPFSSVHLSPTENAKSLKV